MSKDNWYADDGNAAVLYTDTTRGEAAQEYVDDADYGDVEKSFAVTIYTWPEDDEDDRASHLILVHPPEPECTDGKHDYKETWLQSEGAGVYTKDECERCGLIRHWRTCSQGANAATEHDHETFWYERS